QLVEVAEEAEAGHVGGADGARVQGGGGRVRVQRRHGGDGVLEHLAGRLVPVVQDAGPERLGEGERHAGPARVVAEEAVRVGDPGDGHAVLGLGVVHAVAAADVAAREGRDVQAAAQDLPRDLERQDVAGPGEQVHRDEGAAADRVDVRQRVGRGDAAPVVGVVDDRGEEVGGGDGGQAARGAGDADDGGVVAGVEADDQLAVRGRGGRGQAR